MEANPSNSGMTPSLRRIVNGYLKNVPPAALGLFVQLCAFCMAYGLVYLLRGFSVYETDLLTIQFALLQGVIALLISLLSRLALWWHFIHIGFAPALIGALSLSISPAWFFFAFALMTMIYWNTFRTQVPLYLSSQKAGQAIAKLLPERAGFHFIDLGSGLGSLLAQLHTLRSNGIYRGIESAPLPFLFSWLRSRLNPACQTFWGSLWAHNLSTYDVVYAYLSPVPMEDLWRKACSEMRPGTLFISNTFTIPSVNPTSVVQLDDFNQSTLYIWRM